MADFRSVIRHLTFQDGAQEVTRGKEKVMVHPSPWAEFIDHLFHTDDAEVADRLRGLDPAHGVTEDADPAASDDPAAS